MSMTCVADRSSGLAARQVELVGWRDRLARWGASDAMIGWMNRNEVG